MSSHSLLPALLLIVVPAALPTQNNVIRGKVRSTGGSTINNAIVELRTSNGAMISQTVTRNDGDFAFSNLVPGEYEVSVLLAGFEPTQQYVRFNHAPSERMQEILNIEVMIRPRVEAALPSPSVNFAQDVPKAARAAYEKAVAKMREGKSEEATRLLREAISIYDEYFNALFALGGELYREGKYQEALETLERARQINDREGAVYYLFGLVMIKQQKFGVAEYAFRKAMEMNADNAATHFHRGFALIGLALQGQDAQQRVTDLAEAEREMDRAWDMSNKRLTAVYLHRARIYEVRGEKEAAARELEKFLQAEPDAKNAPAVREAILKLRGKK
jgi:tetratricopeptide (TPR) repeat protein